MPSLRDFKAYAIIDANDNHPSIALCYNAAVQAAVDAGIPQRLIDQDNPRATLYIYALAAHYYDNRGAGDDTFIRTTLNKIRMELMYQ